MQIGYTFSIKLLLEPELRCLLIPPHGEYPGILPVMERPPMEFPIRANLPISAEDQFLRRSFHPQFLPQLPKGRGDEIHARRNVPRAGNIIASGPGILGFTPFLQKNFQFSRPHSGQPHMGCSVPDALSVGLLTGNHRPRRHSVFVHHVQQFHVHSTFPFLFLRLYHKFSCLQIVYLTKLPFSDRIVSIKRRNRL